MKREKIFTIHVQGVVCRILLYKSGYEPFVVIDAENNDKDYYNTMYENERIVGSMMCDTKRAVIETLKPIQIKGLYFKDGDKKIQPTNLFFGVESYNNIGGFNKDNGTAFCHYNCALYPVYTAAGNRFRIDNLCNVCASYDGETITDYYKE